MRKEIGAIASPDKIQFAPGLPKTRSGKIMRRILRKIAEDDFGALGDTSTLADPAVVDDLIANRQNQRIRRDRAGLASIRRTGRNGNAAADPFVEVGSTRAIGPRRRQARPWSRAGTRQGNRVGRS